jgi:hypothetical protein
VVEQLPQATNRGSGRKLRTVAPVVLFQTGPSSVVGGVALGNSQSRQSTSLTLQASVLLAHECGTRWCCMRSDEVDAFCRRCASVGGVMTVRGGCAI